MWNFWLLILCFSSFPFIFYILLYVSSFFAFHLFLFISLLSAEIPCSIFLGMVCGWHRSEPIYVWDVYPFLIFNGSIVDLRCVNFCCLAKLLSYTHIYILFYILFHYGLSQDIEYSSLWSTVGPCCLSILCIVVCIC